MIYDTPTNILTSAAKRNENHNLYVRNVNYAEPLLGISPIAMFSFRDKLCFIMLCSLIVDSFSYFSYQLVLHDWYNKGCDMRYALVHGMVHIKDPLLIEKSSPCSSASGFPISLSVLSFTIYPTPFNRKIKCVKFVVKLNVSFI